MTRPDVRGDTPGRPECVGRLDRALFDLVERLRIALEDGLKEASGLHLSEFNVLQYLAESVNGSMRLGDLARKLSFSPSRLSYQIRALEKRGLLSRHPSLEDGRGAYAEISNAGREVLDQAEIAYRAVMKRCICSGLDEGEVSHFMKILMRLNERVSIGALDASIRY